MCDAGTRKKSRNISKKILLLRGAAYGTRRINMRRIILKLGGKSLPGENSKACYFTQTAARWFNNSRNVTPSPKQTRRLASGVRCPWPAPQYRDVILRSHMVSCRGCNCRSGAITRLSRQRSRVRGTFQGRSSAPLPCGRNKGISTEALLSLAGALPTKRR